MPERERFPSERFPGFTAVSLPRPEGWRPFVSHESPLALIKDVPAGEFRPNVVVAITRYPNEVTLPQLADQVSEALAALDSYAQAGMEYRTVQEHEAFRIEGSFIDPRAGTLYQSVWLVRLERGPFVEVVQLTGSCGGGQAETTVIELRAISSGVEFD